jgi:hypothetical protein
MQREIERTAKEPLGLLFALLHSLISLRSCCVSLALAVTVALVGLCLSVSCLALSSVLGLVSLTLCCAQGV